MLHPRIDVGLSVGTSPPIRRTHTMVRAARALGAGSVWLVDHLTGFFPKSVWTPDLTWMARGGASVDAFYEWQVVAGHLASRVGRMRIGIGVTEAVRRHPVVLAQAALTLGHLTGRPPILGVGAGEAENIVPYGLSFEQPVSRLAEALEVMRMCLTAEGPLDFDGRFFRLDGAAFDLRPSPLGAPEIWLAAHGPRMLELTGRYADGWYPAVPMGPERYGESLTAIRDAARGAGRDPAAITASMQLFYLVGRNDADIARQLEHPAVRFLALLAPDSVWKAVGRTHPLGDGFGGMVDIIPADLDRRQVEEAIAAVPSALLRDRLVTGTASEVVSQIRELAEAGLSHVVLSPVSPLVSRRALAHTIRTLPGIVRRLRSGED
jgi:phthiodiolone/phenolphthiodiolone dimycocerosates ketoreductase